jgi:hypothetical protein
MPYYVYEINEGPTEFIKNMEMVGEHESFKEAKAQARNLRGELAADAKTAYKVIFAESLLEAEERLQEPREEPILREWEK